MMVQVITNWMGVERRVFPVGEAVRDPVNAQDAAVWDLVYHEGGYWTWDEVRRVLGIAGQDRGPSSLVRLYNRCHLARRVVSTSHGVRWSYGVTPLCEPLPDAARRALS